MCFAPNYRKKFRMVSLKAITLLMRTLLLLAIEALPYYQSVAQFQKPKMALQILVPRSIDGSSYLKSLMLGMHTIKRRHRGLDLDGHINFTNTNSPDEILKIFCEHIVPKYVNVIVYIRRTDTQVESASSDYILNIASHLGYPVVAWDPFYVGSLESRAESRNLQLAPTIYHQCHAMLALLHRYNWTDFSIVTDTSTSHLDFISSIKQLVKLNNMDKRHMRLPKFTILSTIILNFDTMYEDKEKAEIITTGLNTKDTDTRIFLLHAGSPETKDILEKAKKLNITGSKYMWILSTTSVGLQGSSRAQRAYPSGSIGLNYNSSSEKIIDVIKSSITLWEESLTPFTAELSRRRNASYAPAIGLCSKGRKNVFWEEGGILYKKMLGLQLHQPSIAVPLKFDSNGVNQLVSLEFVNVQEKFDSKYKMYTRHWTEIGRWIPQKRGRVTEMGIEMDDITWPGNAAIPPKGKPERVRLSIATHQEKPYVSYSDTDDTGVCVPPAVPCRLQANTTKKNGSSNGTVDRCCLGLCIDLLTILSERVGFDFDLYEVPDQEWGLKNETTNEWNGLIRLLVDQKADMVMTSLKITKERNAYINFSVPFLQTGITIVVSIRKGAISPTAFLEPYDYPSWCLILVFSVHATGASIFIFEWLSPSGLNQGKTSLREHKFSLFRSFWLIWAMLFGASVSADNPRGVSSRFLANVWALFALVFLASYTANLAAFMITKEEYYDLTGIEDWRLRQPYSLKPPFRYATVPSGSTEENMKKNYPEMYNYMKKFNQDTVDEGIQSLKKQRIHAFIYDATVLDYRVGNDSECDLITVGNWYAETGYGVGFPKGSPYIGKVNKVLLDLQEYGDLERLQRFWLAGACHRKEQSGKSSHHIGILNFTSAFILLAGGMLLGAILLALEHLYFKFGRKCLRKHDKRGCCALVSLSMGKSLTFEQSVLEAIDFHKKHRCKDPLCETQLWKVKHELDLALLRVDKLKTELAQYRKQVDEASKPEDDQNKPNGVRMALRNSQEPSTSKTDDAPRDRNKPEPGATNDWTNRSFRRSPSYTHAISCDTDNGSQKGKPNKVRYHDGKYYVGVSDDDQTESSF